MNQAQVHGSSIPRCCHAAIKSVAVSSAVAKPFSASCRSILVLPDPGGPVRMKRSTVITKAFPLFTPARMLSERMKIELPTRLPFIVCKGGGQLTVGIALLLKRCSHLSCRLDSIRTRQETARRLVNTRNCNQCLCKLGGVARLLTVVAFPKFHLLRSALVVVFYGPLCEIC